MLGREPSRSATAGRVLGGRDSADKKLTALPRNVVAAGLVSLFTDISSEMIVPVLPIFLTAVLGAPVTAVGLIEGVAESTASILRVFAGAISDRTGRRKPLMLFGYGIANLTKPLLAISTAWPQVLAIRFGDRFGKGIRAAPRDALIADSVDASVRGRAFGFHRGMDTAGAAIGPLLASATLALAGDNPRAVFWLASVPGVVSVPIGWRLLKDRPVAPNSCTSNEPRHDPQAGYSAEQRRECGHRAHAEIGERGDINAAPPHQHQPQHGRQAATSAHAKAYGRGSSPRRVATANATGVSSSAVASFESTAVITAPARYRLMSRRR